MVDISKYYRLKSEFVFLYDEEKVYIYNYLKEIVMLKIKVEKEVINAMKKIDGVMPLNEVIYPLSEESKRIIITVINKYLGIFFEEVNYEKEEEIFNNYFVKKYVQNNMGAFKKNALEMINIIKTRVQSSKIILIGCGILGNEILYYLLEMGIKDIVLVDGKLINTLDKKWGYFMSDNDIAKERKKIVQENAMNKYKEIQIDILNNTKELFDYIKDYRKENIYCIVCEDELTTELLLSYNDYFNENKLKWVSIYSDSEKISIGPTIIPSITGCLNCKIEKIELPKYNGFNTIMPQNFKLAASIFSYELLNNLYDIGEYLIKDVSITLGKQFVIKLSGLNGYSNEIIIDPKCKCRKI